MKKCPFCKAEIEDNARFCLYCMKPLKEKEVMPPQKKLRLWWLLPVVVALLLLGLLVMLLVRGENPVTPSESTGAENTSGNLSVLPQESEPTEDLVPGDAPVEGPPVPSDTQPPAGTTAQIPATNQNTTPQTPSGDLPVITPPSTQPNTTEPEETEPDETEPEETEPEVTEPEVTEPEETEPELPEAQVIYTYRAARAGDDFNANYQNSGNDIVITGIEQKSPSSTHRIPATIDGKRVIAIMANAFYGSNARQVYVPTSVKTIWRNAFNGCALTDLYFTHNIYIESIPDGITIHCPQACQNRDYRSYSSMAANYGFTWKEWNG